MNIMTMLTERLLLARINDKGTVNKAFPCKTYATYEAADKATEAAAKNVGAELDSKGRCARYLIVYVPEWNRYVGCIEMSEVLRRETAMGGYLGIEAGFFKF